MTGWRTAAEALADIERTFRAAGIEPAALDARVLLSHAARLSRATLMLNPNAALSPVVTQRLMCWVKRRVDHEPVALILRRREFWSLEFGVSRATLIPRPDSETLVEAALEICTDRDRAWRILDLGTGSGCLLLSILSELPQASGIGVDASAAALRIAARNAARLGFAGRADFALSNWGAAVTGKFDLVVANPPYIATAEWADLQDDVKLYEPPSALLAGADGLDDYRAIAPQLPGLLATEGWFLGEVGAGQAQAALDILARAGLETEGTRRDLGGIERCVRATLAKNETSA